MTNNGTALAEISAARQALARASDIYSVLDIRDIAKAAATLAEARGAGEVANEAKEVQLRAERKAGAFLKELEREQGARTDLTSSQAETKLSDYATTLEEAGIARPTAHRWQKIAGVPEGEFEQLVAQTVEAGKELTQAAVLRLEARLNRPTFAAPPALPDGKFRVIYADPPWQYSNSGVIGETDHYGHAGRHYTSMSISELCELPVKDLAADDAVLFLWVTSPFLEESFEVIRAWGFKYKTSFVWDKVGHNYGHYNSVRHEFLLVCTRGSCTPDDPRLYDSVQSIKKSDQHSEKPEAFREIVDDLYEWGDRIELFARRQAEGWATWGNEV